MPVDVSSSLPQIDLQPGATITVTLDDPGAVLTSLVVHGWQEEPAPPAPDDATPLTWASVPAEPPAGKAA